MMEGQRKGEGRESGVAERDGCIFGLCLSSTVTQCSALPVTRGQTISGLAVNIKGDCFLLCPWSQGDTDPRNTDSTLSHYRKKSAATLKDFTAMNVNVKK